MSKFKVITPVEHDGKRYEVGESISLDEKTAAPLLAVHAISDGKEKPEVIEGLTDEGQSE